MRWKTGIATITLLLFLAPMAQAASITINEGAPFTLDPTSGGEIPFTVTVACEDFIEGGLTNGGNLDVTVALGGAPTWLNGTDQTLTFSGLDCITGGSLTLSQGGAFPVTPDASAPGMVPTDITLDADGATDTASVQVDYVPGYMFMVDGSFPMEVPADGTSFGATIHLFSNARSMAMFEVLERPDCVSVSGVPDFYTVQDDQLAGDLEHMLDLTISVSPCGGEWESDTFTFKTWSHFLDAGEVKTADETITWTFTPAGDAMENGDTEDSPGLGAGLLLVGLLAAALVALRRRE